MDLRGLGEVLRLTRTSCPRRNRAQALGKTSRSDPVVKGRSAAHRPSEIFPLQRRFSQCISLAEQPLAASWVFSAVAGCRSTRCLAPFSGPHKGSSAPREVP